MNIPFPVHTVAWQRLVILLSALEELRGNPTKRSVLDFIARNGLIKLRAEDRRPYPAIFGAGQLLEGNVLTPKLVGDKIGLHALWILFALMAGGALLGFTGVMIAVPVAAVAAVLIRFALAQYLESGYYHDGAPHKRKISAKG